jgi:hypothetical protein
MDREKLAERISDSDIPSGTRELLLVRLKVASHDGCAAVVRDFEAAVTKRRCQVLPSHRRFFAGRGPAPSDKRMASTSFKYASGSFKYN